MRDETSLAASQPPDSDPIVLEGGRVHALMPGFEGADSIAIAAGKILAVGERAQVRSVAGRRARRVDLQGATVLPGIWDSHTHLSWVSTEVEWLDASGFSTTAELAAAVAQRAAEAPAGSWILGKGWHDEQFAPTDKPHRSALDAAAPEHRVFLRRRDGHTAWVNSLCLQRMDWLHRVPDIDGGRVEIDQTGAPTGILVDRAQEAVRSLLPQPTAEDWRRGLLLASAEMAAYGIVGVHDMFIDDPVAEAYAELAHQRALPLRVLAFWNGESPDWERYVSRPPVPFGEQARVAFAGLKLFADGALGSRGAALTRPYADDSSERGLWLHTPEDLRRRARAGALAGYQLAIHAIGDAANREVLDIYAELRAEGIPLRSPRIEHAQVVDPADWLRFADLGVRAAMQPWHAASDVSWTPDRLGAERLAWAYPMAGLVDAGATLLFGSDVPVETPNPWLAISAAQTAEADLMAAAGPRGAKRGCLLAKDAIWGYTAAVAEASGLGDRTGRLVPGAFADLVVVERDPLAAGPVEMVGQSVLMTVLAGQPTHDAGALRWPESAVRV